MGKRNIPLARAFQQLMWFNMSLDPEWSIRMDKAKHQLPPGESWPKEKV